MSGSTRTATTRTPARSASTSAPMNAPLIAASRRNRRVQAERQADRRARRRDDHPGADRTASTSRTCATRRVCGPTATAARAWSRSRASACSRPRAAASPTPGMEVASDSARAVHSQKMVLELLMSDMPERIYKPDHELAHWAAKLGVGTPRFAPRASRRPTLSHPAMAVNLDACIQCTRCVRACREEQVNDVIGYAFRGAHSKIVFDFDDPMGASTCVACGECVQACPTGALAPAKRRLPDRGRQARSIRSARTAAWAASSPTTCKDNTIVRVEGRDGPANHERLCVKGRFGFDYVTHPQRLTKPLIRKPGVPKTADFTIDPDATGRDGVPRGDVGRGARSRRRQAEEDPRHARPQGAGRLRLGQGQQRGGVPVPEARAHGLRHQQRRPLHALVPRVVGGGAARRHRLGRGVEPGDAT